MDRSRIPKITFEYNPKAEEIWDVQKMGSVKSEQSKGLTLERKMMMMIMIIVIR